MGAEIREAEFDLGAVPGLCRQGGEQGVEVAVAEFGAALFGPQGATGGCVGEEDLGEIRGASRGRGRDRRSGWRGGTVPGRGARSRRHHRRGRPGGRPGRSPGGRLRVGRDGRSPTIAGRCREWPRSRWPPSRRASPGRGRAGPGHRGWWRSRPRPAWPRGSGPSRRAACRAVRRSRRAAPERPYHRHRDRRWKRRGEPVP